MNEEDLQLHEQAISYVKAHQKELVQKFADLAMYPSDSEPISIFMAGSPGAGKTEFSKRLIEKFPRQIVRIDADEIRAVLPQFTGSNAEVVQGASALGVEKIYDFVLKHKQNLLLDGTCADYSKTCSNIVRSLDKNRAVEIYYLYQDPLVAWGFTKKREAIEHRNIPKEVFVNAFLCARKNMSAAKAQFRDKVQLHLVIKNFENNDEEIRTNVATLDAFLKETYNEHTLNAILI